MRIICPKCSRPIPAEDVNTTTNIAFCRPCVEAFALTSMVKPDAIPRLSPPEKRLSILEIQGNVLTLILPRGGAKGLGCFLLIFSIFWNGIVSIFVFISAWNLFHTGSMNVKSEGGGSVPDLYAALFLVPFVLIGIGMALATIYIFFTQSSLVMDHERGLFRREIFGMKFDKKFEMAEVKSIKLVVSYTENGVAVYGIGILKESETKSGGLTTGARICFGSGLPEDEKEWLLGEIHSFWKEATWIANE